jgi:5-methylcytosine-specific restriction endonuclease McrA
VRKRGADWRWVYASARWRALRRQVLAEQPWCATAGCMELTHDVDHKVALQDGGAPFDRDNVWGLCKRHHSSKTNKEVRERYAAGR